ncbi:unnamed protein product [Clonostachys byssicola]|uniref:Uncharacterized protein n=1 Tax=Clonostachys byssicola TaxID=160290 RepID=A0A9N9UT19_9HYPO|nr:unnamed protein product [Clonostachys byssicola]
MASKLAAHGFEFHNWAGGEEAAEGFGISHAVVVPANARTIVISGQVGIRDDGTIPSDLEEQITEAFDHVERSLKAAGLGEDAWEYVYSVKTFEVKKNGQDLAEKVVPISRKYLKNTKPAWTGVTVQSLFSPELYLEITVEAFLPA